MRLVIRPVIRPEYFHITKVKMYMRPDPTLSEWDCTQVRSSTGTDAQYLQHATQFLEGVNPCRTGTRKPCAPGVLYTFAEEAKNLAYKEALDSL